MKTRITVEEEKQPKETRKKEEKKYECRRNIRRIREKTVQYKKEIENNLKTKNKKKIERKKKKV